MSRKQKRMGPVGCFGQIENIKRQSLLLISVAACSTPTTKKQSNICVSNTALAIALIYSFAIKQNSFFPQLLIESPLIFY